MLAHFHVVGIDFDTPEILSWHPEDPLDCEVWAHANVGDEHGAAFYQLHICTPLSIRRFVDKRHLFMLDEYCGVEDLIRQLDDFIEAKIGKKPEDPYFLLSQHWLWEYEGMARRERRK